MRSEWACRAVLQSQCPRGVAQELACRGDFVPHKAIGLACMLVLLASTTGTGRCVPTLTPDAEHRFSLTQFASGFPSILGVGPLGIAFVGVGQVLVTDYVESQIYRLPNHSDGQVVGAPIANYGPADNNATDLCQTSNGRLFMTQLKDDKVIEIDANGTYLRDIATGINLATAIASYPDPPLAGQSALTGHLFVSSGDGIYDVDPVLNTKTLLVQGGGPDGLAISPDGATLYAAFTTGSRIRGYRTSDGTLSWTSPVVPGGVDGIALGLGCLTGYIYANLNNGQLWEIGLPGGPAPDILSLIVSGGTRGDFMAADPGVPVGSVSSLLFTQTSDIWRLTSLQGGGWFAPPASSLLPPGQTGLTLSGPAVNRGFALTVFASGFPSNGAGPLGIAFLGTGEVLVTNFIGSRLYKLPNHSDGQIVGAPLPANYGPIVNNASGLAQLGDHVYMTQVTNDKVVEINQSGEFIGNIVSIVSATAVIPFPPEAQVSTRLIGHLLVSGGGGIYDVDPVAKSATQVVTETGLDGLTFSPDGAMLYAARRSPSNIIGYDTIDWSVDWTSGAIPGAVDGIAIGLGTLAGYIYGNTNGNSVNTGSIYEIGLPAGPAPNVITQIATGGSRGDFIAVDPFVTACSPSGFPTLLLTQTDLIKRLDPPGGGWFGPPMSTAIIGIPTTVRESTSETAPSANRLAQNSPNPFNPETAISYSLANPGRVTILIFNVSGRRIRTLEDRQEAAGEHRARWNGRTDNGVRSASGIYFYTITYPDGTRSARKMAILE